MDASTRATAAFALAPIWRRPGQGLKTRQIAAYSVSGAPRSGALTDDSDEVDAADESDAAVA